MSVEPFYQEPKTLPKTFHLITEPATPTKKMNSISTRGSKSAVDWLFFRKHHWASAPDQTTDSSTDCPTCRAFPADGEHSRTCIVRELEEKLLVNVTVEATTEETLAGFKYAVRMVQDEKRQLAKQISGLQDVIQTLQTEKEDLKKRLPHNDAEQSEANLQRAASGHQMRNQQLHHAMQQLEGRIVVLKQELKDAKKSQADLQDMNNALARTLEEHKQQTHTLEEARTALQQKVDTLNQRLSDTDPAKTTLQPTIKELPARNNTSTQPTSMATQEPCLPTSQPPQNQQPHHQHQPTTTPPQPPTPLTRQLHALYLTTHHLATTNTSLSTLNTTLTTRLATATAQLRAIPAETPAMRSARLERLANDDIAALKDGIEQLRDGVRARKEEVGWRRERLRGLEVEIGRRTPAVEFSYGRVRERGGRRRGGGV